jgi:hypothetical protein
MVEFKRANGASMWVADDRVEEYKAAGFVPAATPRQEKPAPAPKAVAEKPVKEEKKPEPKKAPVKSKK